MAHPAWATERGDLQAAITRLEAGLAAGLSREAFHEVKGAIVHAADRLAAAGGKAPQAVRELLAAATAADAVWREAFTASLCSDPEDMAQALGELWLKAEAALQAFAD